MIVVLSGTNRPDCNTLKVAKVVESLLREAGAETQLVNLQELPSEIFAAASYAEKPDSFAPFQQAISQAGGIVVVVPEYNGSFPGVLKYFIDMLKFPESLVGVPVTFVGLGAGEWGGMRSVEQIELIFQYRSAHLYGKRVFLKRIRSLIDESGSIQDEGTLERLRAMVEGFVAFSRAVQTAS